MVLANLTVGLLVVLIVLFVAGFAAAFMDRRRPAPTPADPWESVFARRVMVNLKSGRALDGVLVRRDHGLLFLKNAVLLEQGEEPAPIDGEALVQLVNVDFIQAL
ncbi:RNA binding protein [Arthrobacter phage LittleTokyo]|nr:RNA binding protein [Arthrobacter phage LittleTokyo]